MPKQTGAELFDFTNLVLVYRFFMQLGLTGDLRLATSNFSEVIFGKMLIYKVLTSQYFGS